MTKFEFQLLSFLHGHAIPENDRLRKEAGKPYDEEITLLADLQEHHGNLTWALVLARRLIDKISEHHGIDYEIRIREVEIT